MQKITLDDFKNWEEKKIGVLVWNQEELEQLSKFIGENEDLLTINIYPMILDYERNEIATTVLFNPYHDLERAREEFKKYIVHKTIVSVDQLETPIEYYNGKIICIRSMVSGHFKVGKAYKVIDGTFKDEVGDYTHERYAIFKRFETLDELNGSLRNYTFAKFEDAD